MGFFWGWNPDPARIEDSGFMFAVALPLLCVLWDIQYSWKSTESELVGLSQPHKAE